MVENAAQDYARIFQSANPDREIIPICLSIDDMLARLDEFETLLSNVKAESNDIVDNHLSSIVSFSENFQVLRDRVDKLEQFVEVVSGNVSEVEKSLDIAEDELNVTDYSIKGLLLKPLMAKAKAGTAEGTEQARRSNLNGEDFQPIHIFNSNDYFGGNDISVDSTEEAQES